MPSFIQVAAVLALLYLVICGLMVAFQPRFVFFPESQLDGTPEAVGLAFREVRFRTEDRVDLHGWFVPGAEGGRVALFFHGNAGNISHRLETVRLLHELGLTVFIFDYRGYGQSGGRMSEAGSYRDASAAWRYLVEQESMSPDRIILWGRSLGGAVAVELASRIRPAALVVESSFTSAAELGARIYPWLPVRQLARIRYDSAKRIHRVTCPKLFVHSTADEVVPYGLGLRLFNQAGRPKEMLKIRGSHNDGFLTSGPRYTEGVRTFLASLPE
ncbi:MAG: alpha/beta hydrolase [bacterium]